MSKKNAIREDPTVAKVRAARAKLWALGGGTYEGVRRVVDEILAPKSSRNGGRKASSRRAKPRSRS